MLYNDRPISKDAEDRLGRLPFVDEIVELIDKYTMADENKATPDGLVIGLEGSWGDGKTSVLNLLERRFCDKNERYVVQRLDSWLAMDRVTLTMEFFKVLEAAARDAKAFRDKTDGLKDYAGKVLRGLLTFAANSGVSVTLPVFSVKPNWEKFFNEKSLRQEKDDLKKKLANSPRYIVYMIDDIDRLNSEEISVVMQLIKNIADFPKVIYLLAYDRNIVTEALQRIDGKNGRNFMEKIVQVPIHMPEMGKAELLDYFHNEIGDIASSLKSRKNKVKVCTFQGEISAHKVYMHIAPYLKSIRDCNRILNAFQVRYFICSEFCAADDLLCVVILEVFEPGAISYLVNHYEEFYPSAYPGASEYSDSKSEEYRAKVQREAQCSEVALKLLAALFPEFAKKIRVCFFTEPDPSNATIENKIVQERNFSSYFMLSPNENDVFSSVIKELLLHWEEEQIDRQFLIWILENKLASVFLKIRAYCDLYNRDFQLPQDRWRPILRAMTSAQNIPHGFGQQYLWIEVPWAVVLKMITTQSIIRSRSEYINLETAGWIVDIFHDEQVSIETLDVLMWHIGAGYEWMGCDEFAEAPPEVNKQLFAACKEVFVNRLENYVMKNKIFQSKMRDTLLTYLIREDKAYLHQYLAGLATIEQIFPWLNFALREETDDGSSGVSEHTWHREDDLLAIMPESYCSIVENKLAEMPADWLGQAEWSIFVLYSAYAHQESWTRVLEKSIKSNALKEYGDKIYQEGKRTRDKSTTSKVGTKDL